MSRLRCVLLRRDASHLRCPIDPREMVNLEPTTDSASVGQYNSFESGNDSDEPSNHVHDTVEKEIK